MLMGVPNVGKSSLINALRRRYLKKGDLKREWGCLNLVLASLGKGTRVGATPGITRGVLGKISVRKSSLWMYNIRSFDFHHPRSQIVQRCLYWTHQVKITVCTCCYCE